MSATAAPASSAAPTNAAAPATPNMAYFITQCLQRSIGFAEKLVADIPPEKFASKVIDNCNHPAFIIGHLSLYPNRIFTALGRKDLIVDIPGWAEMFQAGSACHDDAAKYPKKDAIVKAFFDAYRRLAEALPGVSDDVLRRDNPMEGRMREIFPKLGTMVNFLCNNHLMMHLGQISAWRRAAGLQSVM